MNVFGSKLVVVCLLGVLALPVGFCCGGLAEGSPWNGATEHCCRNSAKQGAAPVMAVKSCCCLVWANTSVSAGPEKPCLTCLFRQLICGQGHISRPGENCILWPYWELANIPSKLAFAFGGSNSPGLAPTSCDIGDGWKSRVPASKMLSGVAGWGAFRKLLMRRRDATLRWERSFSIVSLHSDFT